MVLVATLKLTSSSSLTMMWVCLALLPAQVSECTYCERGHSCLNRSVHARR